MGPATPSPSNDARRATQGAPAALVGHASQQARGSTSAASTSWRNDAVGQAKADEWGQAGPVGACRPELDEQAHRGHDHDGNDQAGDGHHSLGPEPAYITVAIARAKTTTRTTLTLGRRPLDGFTDGGSGMQRLPVVCVELPVPGQPVQAEEPASGIGIQISRHWFAPDHVRSAGGDTVKARTVVQFPRGEFREARVDHVQAATAASLASWDREEGKPMQCHRYRVAQKLDADESCGQVFEVARLLWCEDLDSQNRPDGTRASGDHDVTAFEAVPIRGRGRRGATTTPDGMRHPVSSKTSTPLHSSLHPISGRRTRMRAAS